MRHSPLLNLRWNSNVFCLSRYTCLSSLHAAAGQLLFKLPHSRAAHAVITVVERWMECSATSMARCLLMICDHSSTSPASSAAWCGLMPRVLRVLASQLGNLALEVSCDLELSSTLRVEGLDSLIRNQQLCAIYLR